MGLLKKGKFRLAYIADALVPDFQSIVQTSAKPPADPLTLQPKSLNFKKSYAFSSFNFEKAFT